MISSEVKYAIFPVNSSNFFQYFFLILHYIFWNLSRLILTSSNGNGFRVTGPLWKESCGFPSQRPATRSFNVFFDLHLNKRIWKQSRHRLSETQSASLNITVMDITKSMQTLSYLKKNNKFSCLKYKIRMLPTLRHTLALEMTNLQL